MWEDGTYVIYRIQHYVEGTKEWDFSNLDHFGCPDGFSASDECWQKTGVKGCFDFSKAREGLEWIQKVNKFRIGLDKDRKFRLVCVTTSQETLVV